MNLSTTLCDGRSLKATLGMEVEFFVIE